MALSLGPGKRLPTVAQLCASFQVSSSTLDPILRNLETRGVIVRQHGSGIFVAPTVRQKTIGVVFGGDIYRPDFSPFWGLLLLAVREQAGEHECRPRAYFDIAESAGGFGGHAQLVEDLESHRLDGLLLLAPHYDHDEAAELRAHGVPLVVFGSQSPADWSVTLDWEPFLQMVVRELAAIADCRRIGFLGTPAHATGLKRSLDLAVQRDIRLDDWSYETWANIIPDAGTRENCARRLTEQMIAGRAIDPLPDTLVSLEDTMTRGAITALTAAGVQPGRDIRIVTAENQDSPVLEPWAAALTRIAFDPRACVRAALEMLETLMNGGTPPVNPVRVGPVGRET